MDKRAAIEALLAEDSSQPPSKFEALARGGGQGATLGFGDEAGAAVGAALQKVLPESLGGLDYGKPYGQLYQENRDVFRKENETARKTHPWAYGVGEVAGSLPLTIATGAGGSVGGAALQGAVQGAGLSNADLTRGDVKGLARDASVGAGLGVGAYGAGTLLKALLGRTAAAAGQRAASAATRAGQAATEEVGAQVQSAAGKFGTATQQGSRYIENLMRLEESMTPAQRAIYQELQASGVVPNLQQQVAQSTLQQVPGQAATIAERQAALQAAQAGAPQAIAERTAQMLSPETAKAQVMARLLRYGPPALGSAAGAAIGGPVGVAIGGLAGAGTRPMVQALRRMAQNPAVQYQVASAMERAAAPGAGTAFLRNALTGGAPSMGADYARAALGPPEDQAAPGRGKINAAKAAAIDRLLSEESK